MTSMPSMSRVGFLKSFHSAIASALMTLMLSMSRGGFDWISEGVALNCHKAKVAWSDVCQLLKHGGLGVKQLKVWNHALLIKQMWAYVERRLWVFEFLMSIQPLGKILTSFYSLKAAKEYDEQIKSGVLVGMWFELLCGLVLYKFIRIFFAEDDLIDIETSDSDAAFAVASRIEKVYGGKMYVGFRIPDAD
ncbi:hypothetical protein Droror1_Dr00007569 [Drosera rotundifolia]